MEPPARGDDVGGVRWGSHLLKGVLGCGAGGGYAILASDEIL